MFSLDKKAFPYGKGRKTREKKQMAIWHRRYVIGDSFVKDLSFLSKFNVSSPPAPNSAFSSLPHQHLRVSPPTSRRMSVTHCLC